MQQNRFGGFVSVGPVIIIMEALDNRASDSGGQVSQLTTPSFLPLHQLLRMHTYTCRRTARGKAPEAKIKIENVIFFPP